MRTTASGGASRLICPALTLQLARQRDRLAVRRELHPGLPPAEPGGQGLGRLSVLEPLVLRLVLRFGLRHRDVRALLLLLDGMPAMSLANGRLHGRLHHAYLGVNVARALVRAEHAAAVAKDADSSCIGHGGLSRHGGSTGSCGLFQQRLQDGCAYSAPPG
jgi:hypothetical protein